MRILLSSLLTLLVSSTGLAQSFDCVSINKAFDQIQPLVKSGKYRDLAANDIQHFSYQSSQSYQEYLTFVASKISAENPKATMKCPVETGVTKLLGKKTAELTIADLVKPFELKVNNNDKAILLIHGLTDSPFLFHDLASFYHKQGFNVRTLLLPGHGTAAQALIDVTYQDWQQATRYAIDTALADFKQVYLGGFSTGGALILDYLLSNAAGESRIDGVMLWAPASKAKSKYAWAAQYVDWIPFLDYTHKAADIDFAKYESFPLNAGAQVHALMTKLNEKLAQADNIPDIPVLTVTTEADSTIETQATVELLEKWHRGSNRQSRELDTLFYFGQPDSLSVLPNSVQRVFAQCSNAEYCQQVLNVAHTAVTNSPTNPHYGWQGAYRNCEAVSESKAYQQCKLTEKPILGETTSANMAKYPALQRLTFNPSFDQMLQTLTVFISQTSKGIK